jgi:cyclophilin family peptidyl-prolyl cis-trans isomerase
MAWRHGRIGPARYAGRVLGHAVRPRRGRHGPRGKPDSANSQFFIMFEPGYFLNGEYTVFGRVIEGMEVVDAIKRGDQGANGAVNDTPDRMVSVRVED